MHKKMCWSNDKYYKRFSIEKRTTKHFHVIDHETGDHDATDTLLEAKAWAHRIVNE